MAISITATEREILHSVVLPPRPEALIKVSMEAKKPEPDLKVIAQTIASDVSISAAVLQIVNSAAFRRAKEIESIQQAVMTLGLKRLLPLVKSVALKSAMGQADKLADFWQVSNQIAASASLAATLINKPALIDNAYMLGLFHNAGIPIMMLKYEDYAVITQYAQTHGWEAASQLERKQYGTSYTTISALLGQQWKLPAVMIEVIYYQLDTGGLFTSGELSAVGLDLMCILKLARFVVHQYHSPDTPCQEWLQVQDDFLARFNVYEEELESMCEELHEMLRQGG